MLEVYTENISIMKQELHENCTLIHEFTKKIDNIFL